MCLVLAGAVLADLALERRIDTDLESLTLIDATPTGDELLDPVLAEIAAEAETHNAQFWVERTAARSDAVLDMVLTRLVANKILHQEIGGFWSVARQVSRSGTYREADGTVRQEVKSRIRQTIVENEIPDPRDAIIIGLVNSCDAFRYLLPEEDYEQARAGLRTSQDNSPVALGSASGLRRLKRFGPWSPGKKLSPADRPVDKTVGFCSPRHRPYPLGRATS